MILAHAMKVTHQRMLISLLIVQKSKMKIAVCNKGRCNWWDPSISTQSIMRIGVILVSSSYPFIMCYISSDWEFITFPIIHVFIFTTHRIMIFVIPVSPKCPRIFHYFIDCHFLKNDSQSSNKKFVIRDTLYKADICCSLFFHSALSACQI